MNSPTEYRRRLALAVAIAFGLTVLALAMTFAAPARAEPPDIAQPAVAPLCPTGEDVLKAFSTRGLGLVSAIGRSDLAQAAADALAERFHAPSVPVASWLIFSAGDRTALVAFGFDGEGCVASRGALLTSTWNGLVEPLGIAPVTLPAKPPPAVATDPNAI